jgi:hypothetical protein
VLQLQLTSTVNEAGIDPFNPDKQPALGSNTAASPQQKHIERLHT